MDHTVIADLEEMKTAAQDCLDDILGIAKVAKRRHSDWVPALKRWISEYSRGLLCFDDDPEKDTAIIFITKLKECVMPEMDPFGLWATFASTQRMTAQETLQMFESVTTTFTKCPMSLVNGVRDQGAEVTALHFDGLQVAKGVDLDLGLWRPEFGWTRATKCSLHSRSPVWSRCRDAHPLQRSESRTRHAWCLRKELAYTRGWKMACVGSVSGRLDLRDGSWRPCREEVSFRLPIELGGVSVAVDGGGLATSTWERDPRNRWHGSKRTVLHGKDAIIKSLILCYP